MAALSADEPEALLVLQTGGAVTDLAETLVQQHLLGVGRDQPQVGPSHLQQHRPVPGLVTAAGGGGGGVGGVGGVGGGITVILGLAGTDWKYQKC